MKAEQLRIEGSMLALVFLDLLGFGMLIPDVQLRAEEMGAPGWLIGVLLSSMSVVQLVVSPLWGRLSDRTGRKPIVIACTLLSAAAMAVYAFAFSPWMILVSRVLAGLGAANVAVAQAYVSDLAASGSKVAAMGRMGAAVSAGLVAGPALGGFLAEMGGNLLLGLTAAGCSLFGTALAAVALPWVRPVKASDESTDAEVAPYPREQRGTLGLLRSVPGLARVFMVIATGWFALAILEGTFGRLIRARLGMGQAEFGLIFGYESLIGVAVQAFLVAKVTKVVPIPTALRAAFVLTGIGLGLFPFAPGLWALFFASTLYAVGSSIANPTANALCSDLTPDERQGELFGLMQSARSFGFLIGPVLGGALFDVSHSAPYILAAVVCVGAALAVPAHPSPSPQR